MRMRERPLEFTFPASHAKIVNMKSSDWSPEQRARYMENKRRWRAKEIAKDPEAFYANQRKTVNERRTRQMAENPLKETRRRKGNYMQYKYGISIADFDKMIAATDNRCECCGKHHDELPEGKHHDTRLHVDHCHTSGRVRGLLCFKCNVLMGLADESPETLKNAVAYLESH